MIIYTKLGLEMKKQSNPQPPQIKCKPRYYNKTEKAKMRLITDINEIVGKTVTKATFVDWDKYLAIVFDDDTCIYVDKSSYDGCIEFYLQDNLCCIGDKNQYAAGIITRDEYDRRLLEREEKKKLEQDIRNRKLYEELKKLYGEEG